MLATNSVEIQTGMNFESAMGLLEEKPVNYRILYTEDGEETEFVQLFNPNINKYSSPHAVKDISVMKESKETKLKKFAQPIYENVLTTPQLVGSDNKNSWLLGNIDNVTLGGEEYDIDGILISSIFDPVPKFYISFKRIICENQFGSLGSSSSSMYIDMTKLMQLDLASIVSAEIDRRIAVQEKYHKKMRDTKLDEKQIKRMFEMLTVDKVARSNETAYAAAKEQLKHYKNAYNVDDNQNYKGTFMGFVNACTNYNTRHKESPLDVIKPVVSPALLDSPVNFEYLCRNCVANAV